MVALLVSIQLSCASTSRRPWSACRPTPTPLFVPRALPLPLLWLKSLSHFSPSDHVHDLLLIGPSQAERPVVPILPDSTKWPTLSAAWSILRKIAEAGTKFPIDRLRF